MVELVGLGVYTPAEAGRLLQIQPSKIVRWLKGHKIGEKNYDPLWEPEVNLQDTATILGFRDLMEMRVVNAFILAGIPPVRIRAIIKLAREVLGQDHPLSTHRFRTDGREIFLNVIETDPAGQEHEHLLNIFRKQYEFKSFIDPLLKSIDFNDGGVPSVWWPRGRKLNVKIDPSRSFGQPIEASSSVPTSILAACAKQEGIRGAAQAFDVGEASIRRAVEFESLMGQSLAA